MKDYTKGKNPEMLEPFFPNELFRHIIAACFLIVIELITVIVFPLPFKLVNKPDSVPWFLLPIYKLNKFIHNEALFISLLVICALLFVSWPFLASIKEYKPLNKSQNIYSNKVRHNLWQRPIPFLVVILTLISLITLCFINP